MLLRGSVSSLGLERESPQEAPSATPRSSDRARLALVFLLAMAFSLLSYVPFFAVVLVYGPAAARSLSLTDPGFFIWLRRSFAIEFFLAFYILGKRIDFRGQYLPLALLTFAAVLVGELPTFV